MNQLYFNLKWIFLLFYIVYRRIIADVEIADIFLIPVSQDPYYERVMLGNRTYSLSLYL